MTQTPPSTPAVRLILYVRDQERSRVFYEAALGAYTKAGFAPYRDFVENGEPYRYLTRTLT